MANKRLQRLISVVLSLVLLLCIVPVVSAQEDYAASVNGVGYTTVAEAASKANGGVVKLLKDSREQVTANGDLYLDLNGYTLSGVTVTGGTLYGMDSTTDDYDCKNGYGKILNFSGSYASNYKTNITGAYRRYLAVEESGVVSFHRIYLGIVKVSIRPGQKGMGYKARFCGDEVALAQMDSFGIKMNLDGYGVVTQTRKAAELDINKEYSVLLRNYDAVNFGDTTVYAWTFIKLKDHTMITSVNYSSTLKAAIEQVNDTYQSYTEQQLSSAAEWIKTTPNMLQWRVENILFRGPKISIGNVIAKSGQSVEVPVVISGNPGIAGAKITVSYPEQLTLTSAVSGEAFSYLQYTNPGKLQSPCSFTWDSENGEATENGVILVLTFAVASDTQVGETFEIGCSYRMGDIYDEDLNDVEIAVNGGTVTIPTGGPVVTFVDYDGTVLKTEAVESGQSATAPEAPIRDGYIFTGWDKDFTNVTQSMTVTAQYEKLAGPMIYVGNVSGRAGQSVEVPVMISGNPGIAGAKITISYPKTLTLASADSGEAFSYLQFTRPGKFQSPCNFTWDSESGEAADNGIILTLTFTIAADAQPGECFEIGCSYRTGDIYDENLDDVLFTAMGGMVTIPTGGSVVTFADYDGTVLKTEAVEPGQSATAPEAPIRDGYIFTGWDKDFTNVTQNITVTAQYEKLEGALVYIGNVNGRAGQTVEVPVMIVSNPGIAGAKITVNYPTMLTLTGAVSGEAFSYLQYTKPGRFSSPCNFTWDSESGEATDNGIILTLTFVISADAQSGDVIDIGCSYRAGDFYDENLNDVQLAVLGGKITVV